MEKVWRSDFHENLEWQFSSLQLDQRTISVKNSSCTSFSLQWSISPIFVCKMNRWLNKWNEYLCHMSLDMNWKNHPSIFIKSESSFSYKNDLELRVYFYIAIFYYWLWFLTYIAVCSIFQFGTQYRNIFIKTLFELLEMQWYRFCRVCNIFIVSYRMVSNLCGLNF